MLILSTLLVKVEICIEKIECNLRSIGNFDINMYHPLISSHFVLGAITAVFLVANIAGSLIAVVAFIAFVNGILGWFGGLIGIAELSIELIFGYIFIPLAWLMGVDYEV